MPLVCKRCGKQNIDGEAYNSRQGGFLCRSCYRSTRLRIALVGILPAGLVVALAALLLFALLIWMSGG